MRTHFILLSILVASALLSCGDGRTEVESANDGGTNNGGTNGGDVDQDDGTISDDGGTSNDGGTTDDGAANNPGGETLASKYPGDDGIGSDPAVVWHEDFEQGSIDQLANRYDNARTNGMSFSAAVPANSSGSQSVVMSAGGTNGEATDLFKQLDGHQQLYVRYYVKYEDAPYHHTGMWMGGYNPPTPWPNPQAGEKPNGDDRVSIAIEPNGEHPMGKRLEFYNYWRGMHTWKAPGEPTGSGSWYGNAAIHRNEFFVRENEWMCVEMMLRLNDDPSSMAGGELAVWSEDQLLYHYTEQAPLGYWIRDKFCPADADAAACLDYAPAEDQREQEPLDVQWRSSADLQLNWIWPQNYITSGSGDVGYDDIVVATSRIGCIR